MINRYIIEYVFIINENTIYYIETDENWTSKCVPQLYVETKCTYMYSLCKICL